MLQTSKRRLVVVAVAIVLIGSVMSVALLTNDDDDELIVRFFNIGHGLSILVQTPDGKNILIDAGSFSNTTSTMDFLDDLNVTTIDAFIITHPHPDHISFAAEVLEDCDVLAVYMPGMADTLEPTVYAEVMQAIADEGCPVYNDTTIDPGDYLELSEDVTFQVMWIDANATLENDSCLVLRMDYEGTSFLFTGDIETEAETAMMGLGLDLDIDVLQVAHHGVDSGTSSEFLNMSTPEVAVISCGMGYGDPQVPQPGVVARLSGIPTYVTMLNNTVVINVDSEGYDVS